jgi:hypothetical protein
MKPPRSHRGAPASTILVLAALVSVSQAATLELGHIFSDTPVAPDLAGPWLTVATTNLGSNQIRVDLTAERLSDPEYVSEWYLNLDPTLDPGGLGISASLLSGAFNVPAAASLLVGANAYKADGDGKYDIKVIFESSDGTATRFTDGDSLRLTLTYTGAGTFNESSLIFPSAPDGGTGPFLAAAHINATGLDDSGSAWVAAVPEPSVTMNLLLAGSALLAIRRRRTR